MQPGLALMRIYYKGDYLPGENASAQRRAARSRFSQREKRKPAVLRLRAFFSVVILGLVVWYNEGKTRK